MDHTEARQGLVSVVDTARQLGVGRTTVYGEIDSGRLTRVKIGSRALITQESIDRYISALVAEAAAE